ncbi:MAG: insulinase family protein [Deltaproteobacteria bacterium]|nr:insulinase family protein [Deltaproteobacteria bacterium]
MKKDSNTERVSKHVLDNGTRVLVDEIPHLNTVAVGLCCVGGSRDETPETNGVSHLLEHLLFKRTSNLSVRDIAEQIDELGGEINACTDPDSLLIHGVVPEDRADALLELLASLIADAQFTEDDLEVEKEIIRQEILDSDDHAGDATYRHFRKQFWKDTTLGSPVAGTKESVEGLGFKDVTKRLKTLRCGARTVLSVAGRISAKHVQDFAQRSFGAFPPGHALNNTRVSTLRGSLLLPRQANQTYLVYGFPWPGIAHEDFLAAILLSSLLGQGNSSALFQRLREEEGLSYDIDAGLESYADTSAFTVSASFERENLDRVLELLFSELERVVVEGISERAVSRHRNMLTAQLELEWDSVVGRMNRILETEMMLGRYVHPSEIRKRLEALTVDQLRAFAAKHLRREDSLLVLGGDIDKTHVKG